MLQLQDVFTDSRTVVFAIIDYEDDNELNWLIKPTKFNLIPEEEGYYIVRALEVNEEESKNCFIDVHIPERISEIVIRQDHRQDTFVESIYDSENSVIPAVASEAYGEYDLYYAQENPEVGLDILKKGFEIAENKSVIAEDLGYILRDENRLEEAVEAFKTAEKLGPNNEYVYLELSYLYADLGNEELEQAYYQKYKDNGGISPEDINSED